MPKIKFRIKNQLEKSQLHVSDSPNLSNDSDTSTSDSVTDSKGFHLLRQLPGNFFPKS